MNSENQNNLDGETSRNSEESSSNITTITGTTETTTSPAIDKYNLEESIINNINQNQIELDTTTLFSNTESINNIEEDNIEKKEINKPELSPVSKNISDQITHSIVSTITNAGTPITSKSIVTSDETEEMKRASAKKLIERYFYQLLDGCGRKNCENKYCASSGEIEKLTPNQAAARAIQLFSQDAKLCDTQPSKIARTSELTSEQTPSTSSSSSSQIIIDNVKTNKNGEGSSGLSHLGTTTVTTETTTQTNYPSSSFSSSNSCINSLIDSQHNNDNNDSVESYNFTLSSRLPQTSSRHPTKTNNATITTSQNQNDDSSTSSSATTPSSHSSSASANSTVTTATTTTPSYIPPNDRLINNEQIINASNSSAQTIPKKIDNIISTQPIPPTYLDEDILYKLIEECQRTNSYSKIMHRIGEVFSSAELLIKSFRKKSSSIKVKNQIDKIKTKSTTDIKNLKKEDIRTLEGDLDKDEDSSTMHNETGGDGDCGGQGSNTYDNNIDDINEELTKLDENDTIIDINSFRRSMEKLFTVDFPVYEALNNALHSLSILLSVDLRMSKDKKYVEKAVHVFLMIFELMTMALSEFLDVALPNICRAAARLPTWAQAKLAKIWAQHCKTSLRSLLQTLQQLISIQAITCSINRSHVEDSDVITSATKILKIVYYANILAGKLESPINNATIISGTSASSTSGDALYETIPEDDDFYIYSHVRKSHGRKNVEDNLEKELGLTVMDCRIPLIPFEEFYNEPLSDTIEMDNDYLYYKNYTMDTRVGQDKKFTFMLYSFILTPATKVIALYYDSRIRMYSERRMSLFHQSSYYGETNGAGPNPYLKLKVRRDQLIDDALVELEMIAMGTPKDFKKQLVVEFVGEQGIDEGGVSKEFFQLVIEEIFNPDFGMFIYQEDSKTVWFNSTSFENEAQFTLIGIVLGLAIYNNIILAVNFPMVVYRKLMGGRGTFYDLQDWNPVIFNSLKSILDYDNDDMEDVFMQTFKISYTDVFGNTIEHDLKENGGDIMVNQNNKLEFIELYSDYLLNVSIDRQFKAFKKGFEMVTDESPLKLLFRSEEIELLVCGSRKFDFIELEKSTEYEGGYTDKSQTIIDFWNIVHGLPMESKRKLLEFTTGSDRVPVGGLSRLKLVIARNGPDSDRLPTSHTCFNVLLLPEYDTKEKLEDRLLKAINYSKGFGML